MQLRKFIQMILIIGFLLISLCFGISSMAQQIKPVAASPQLAGAEFTVEIKVENVTNLFGVSFVLHYTHNTDYIDALSAVKGDFLGSDVIWLDPVIDDSQGTVSIGITRKRPASGVDGSGVVAKVTFKSASATPNDTSVDFTITDIVANDPSGVAIPLTPQPLTVIINQHTVAITSDPTAIPNTLPSSGGNVNLSVTAEDSLGHAINYNWTVSPIEGIFDDAKKQNPVWTVPSNPTGSDKIYTLTVTASCSVEPSIKDTGSVQVTVKGTAPSAIIKPVAVSPQLAGVEFTVDIRVENVKNLFGISFVLHYTHNADYIDALSAVKGDFLGSDVIWLDPVIDDSQGTVSMGITRKRPASGVDGSGVVAKVTFKSASATPNDTSVDFTITDIVANDPSGVVISLTPQPLTVIITSGLSAIIKPVADSSQQAGVEFTVEIKVENVTNLFGVSFVLHYTHNTDYIDALSAVKGDFLGSDVIWLDPVIDDSQGTVSIGITRKRPAGGVDGSGVVAKVTFKSKPETPNGTPIDFTITEIAANDPSGIPISLTPQTLTVTITYVECLRGDVSGNGTISAYDASLILQFVVGLIDKFPADASPNSSMPRNYSISVPHLTVAAGNRINAPITINDASGVTSGGIALRYDPNVLRAVNVFTSDMLSGYYWESNIKRKGEVRIAFAGPQTLSGESTLFYVEFEALPNSSCGVSPLILDIAQLSETLNITKVNGSITALPLKSKLLQNYPNPFNPDTWIPYFLSKDADVIIRIYNSAGQLVRTLHLGRQVAGIYIDKDKAAYWDGKDDLGQQVASGVYYYTLRAGNFSATRKMVIIK